MCSNTLIIQTKNMMHVQPDETEQGGEQNSDSTR